jgi:hypothetical protein
MILTVPVGIPTIVVTNEQNVIWCGNFIEHNFTEFIVAKENLICKSLSNSFLFTYKHMCLYAYNRILAHPYVLIIDY